MDSSSILLRQVHPTFVQADIISTQVFSITSQVFKPTPKDEGFLSMYNDEKFTPEESHSHFTSENGKSSFGVVGVSGIECENQQLKWAEDNDPFDGHSHIDFNGLTKGEIEKKAKFLKSVAMKRGWLYKRSG